MCMRSAAQPPAGGPGLVHREMAPNRCNHRRPDFYATTARRRTAHGVHPRATGRDARSPIMLTLLYDLSLRDSCNGRRDVFKISWNMLSGREFGQAMNSGCYTRTRQR